jgi:hypothetical protein
VHRPLFASGAFLTAAAALLLSSCGSSNATPSGTATSAPSATSAPANAGSSFCVQAAGTVAQLAHISTGFAAVSPGATPNVASLKQLFSTADSAVDALDSSAPSAIASAFHTLRSAYDTANAQVQSATTIEQLSAAVSGISVASVSAAGEQITGYMQSSCGIATPTP